MNILNPMPVLSRGIKDNLASKGGIMDLWVREARLFKFGSGTGTNFSAMRASGEALSGGGQSSGLMSFLKIGDRAAGAIKSGGTTRRAAKMVILNTDHPDIEEFISWKSREEHKVVALVAGSIACERHLNKIMKACLSDMNSGDDRFDLKKNSDLASAVRDARKNSIPDNYIYRVVQFARQGYEKLVFETYNTDWDSEAYQTVSGQNSNNSVRVDNKFMESVQNASDWHLINRVDGSVAKTIKARDLWDRDCRCCMAVRRSGHTVRYNN